MAFAPMVLVFIIWLVYMFVANKWYLFIDNWYMSITMIFGSFVAGASSEGGGAIAFPVMTLFFKIPPDVARNFSFAIQSIGMTAAAYLIIKRKIKIEKTYLLLASIGGSIGIVLSTYFVVPYVHPKYAKMMFVTFWLSFAIILYLINHIHNRDVRDTLPNLQINDKLVIIFIGLLGGGLSAILGSGIDILTFAFVTMRYQLSEKVATPTSVVLMAGNTLVGFALHTLIIQDFTMASVPSFEGAALNYWLVCIPVVIIGAPFGAYFISTRTRNFVIYFLYIIIVVQFISAILILRPQGDLIWFTAGIFITGILFFMFFGGLLKRKPKQNKKESTE